MWRYGVVTKATIHASMDYETADGSQFSLRDVWIARGGEPAFAYTSVSAYVDGSAYVGKLPTPPDEVDEVDVLTCLEPVPPDCIHPKIPHGFTIAPDFDPVKHYLKAPSYTYDDCQPGKAFVADCVLNEVTVLERLKLHPHPNIVSYLGCVVKDGRITHICLDKYPSSLVAQAEQGLEINQSERIFEGIQAGISYLHDVSLAHNDINPENICLDVKGEPIIVDFDACLPFGEKLLKGASMADDPKGGFPISSKYNDLICGIDTIKNFLDANVKNYGNNEKGVDLSLGN